MTNTALLQRDAQVLHSPRPPRSAIMYFKMFFGRWSEKDDKIELLQIKDKNIFHKKVVPKEDYLVSCSFCFMPATHKQTYSVLLPQLVKGTPIQKCYKPEFQSAQKKTHSIVPLSLLPKLKWNSLFSTAKKVSGRERTFFWHRMKCSIHWTMPYASACFISDALDHSTVSGLSFP